MLYKNTHLDTHLDIPFIRLLGSFTRTSFHHYSFIASGSTGKYFLPGKL
jgi:hypothetical protein